MSSTMEKTGTNEVRLTITVPSVDFEQGLAEAFRHTGNRYNVPGFRKGKAPRKVIENYYGDQVFFEEGFRAIYPKAVDDAITEHGLEAVDSPNLDIVNIEKGQDLIFTADVVVRPEVTLGMYKGIEAQRPEYTVTDVEIDDEIARARERLARWEDVPGPAEMGHMVTMDYMGFTDGEQFSGGTAEDQTLELGTGRFIPGFEEQMVGMMPGDEREINVTFPEQYHSEDLAGKPAVFKVTLKGLKAKDLPELDDEFAKDASTFDTLEAYKNDIRERLTAANTQKADSEFENALIERIVANAQMEIPEVMVDNQIHYMMRDMDYRMRFQGFSLDAYMQMTGATHESMHEEMHDEAEKRVKNQLVLEEIQKAEQIACTTEEVDEKLTEMAERAEKTLEEYKAEFPQEQMRYIEDEIKIDKVMKLIKDSAVIIPASTDQDT